MKQVKSVILAVFLVLTLSTGVLGGDIGSPGVRTTSTGDIGSPTKTTISDEPSDETSASTESNTSDVYDSLLLDTMSVLLSLF